MIKKVNVEEGKTISKKIKTKLDQQQGDLAKDLYGDEYGKEYLDSRINPKYPVSHGMNFASGPFSIGNGKLSPDTLIINFTSAQDCPSKDKCPVTQLACYASAGELRLPATMRKNIEVQKLWIKSYQKGDLSKMFAIAETYISEYNEKKSNGKNVYKTGIRYIRYNEAGDFPNMAFVQAAANFSKKMKDEYGVLSMAYTANPRIDFSQPLNGTNIPIDHIIKINASRQDIKLSQDVVNQDFWGMNMEFAEEQLENNEKAEYVSLNGIGKLKYIPPTDKYSKNGIKSTPYLQKGKWKGGEGWFYICPCSFTIRDKNRITDKYLQKAGLLTPEILNNNYNDSVRDRLISKLPKDLKDARNKEINKIKSPCGIDCAVCHDMEGGILPNGERTLNYSVLNAIHGAMSSNYNEEYSNQKRLGNDNVIYSMDNPYGVVTKFKSPKEKEGLQKLAQKKAAMMNSPIRPELVKYNMDMDEPDPNYNYSDVNESKKNEKLLIMENKIKEDFKIFLDRINNVKF